MPSRQTVVLVSLLLATPAVIFWLWLMFLPVRIELVCPEECRCKNEGRIVNCSYSGLNSIPSNIPTHVRILEITGNNITYFQNGTFVSSGLVEVEIFWADFCKLRNIELGAFKGLTKLMFLSVQFNNISEIIPGTFENISGLEFLLLGGNIIEHLESDVFNGLVNLKMIGLQGNKLKYLHPDTFSGLSKFQGLQIKTDSNILTSFLLKIFSDSDCNTRSVSVKKFANTRGLKLLNLVSNNLRSIDINILKVLPNLSAMFLGGNPLLCNCQLQEVWRWCEDHNIQTAIREEAPKCFTPSEVKGLWWGVLGNGQCFHGNIQYYGDYKNTSYICAPVKDIDTHKKAELFTEINEGINFSWALRQYKLSISAVLFIFGTTGNIIIIMIITCNKDMRTVPNMYIINLAISDVIYLTAVFFESCTEIIHDKMISGDRTCVYLTFSYRMSVGLTAYSVSVLSFQRYRVVVNPLNVCVSSKPTWRTTGATICGVWIVAALLAIPETRSEMLCSFSYLLWRTKYYQHVAIFQLLVSCVLPVFVIAFSYITTALHLVKSPCSLSEETQNSRLNTRKNTAKVVLGLTVVFLISYLPYHFSEMILHYSFNLDNSVAKMAEEAIWVLTFDDIRAILKLFPSINSCLNPVALCCTSLAIRREFKRYLTCCCKAKSTPTDFELEGRH